MSDKRRVWNLIKSNWLFCLIIAQPLLDILAYWTRNEEGTAAGYIRLAVMLALPLYLLITLKNKKRFIASMLVIGAFCAAHLLNCIRIGSTHIAFETAYIARVAQMPILAVCFTYFVRDEKTKKQAVNGILTAAAITFASILIACITGTANSTYGDGIGISGWVIDSNRCANSIILVTLSAFSVYLGTVSEKRALNTVIPLVIFVLLLSNGTKACYFSLYALFAGFAAFIVLRRIICGEKHKLVTAAILLVLVGAAFIVYPYTPRAEIDGRQNQGYSEQQRLVEEKLSAMGYDVYSMSFEEKFNNPEVREVFEQYYRKMMYYVIPEAFDRFGMERMLIKYDMTVYASELGDTRLLKRTYASLIWEDSDALTKLLGIEIAPLAVDTRAESTYDLENDWHAVFYYYGIIGFALYALYLMYFVWLIIKRLFRDLKGSFDYLNFTLLITFALQLGLAELSGALVRRPNVSIYMSLLLALIYYQTAIVPISGSESDIQEANA